MRAGCAGVLVAVVVVGVRRPPSPVDIERLTEAQDRRVCVLVDAFLSLAVVGVSPPADATPEDFAATVRVNASLALIGETLRRSEIVREMGC